MTVTRKVAAIRMIMQVATAMVMIMTAMTMMMANDIRDCKMRPRMTTIIATMMMTLMMIAMMVIINGTIIIINMAMASSPSFLKK